MENWKNLLVCVCTPISGGDEGVYGTAVPVGPNLLLTARHVVRPEVLQPPRQRHPKKPIMIRWWYAQDAKFKDKFEPLAADEKAIIWESEKFDVALLRAPVPDCDVGKSFCRLSVRRPRDHMMWSSEGFPQVYEFNHERRPQSCGGRVYSKADGENLFEITADALEHDGDWSGASGMPVVVEGKIIGVVLQVPKKMHGARLHAAPVWKLLEDSTFRSAIQPGEDEAIRTAALGRLKIRLHKPGDLLATLKNHPEQTIQDAAKRHDVVGVVDAIGRLDLKQVLGGLHALWKGAGDLQPAIQAFAIDVAAALSSSSSLAALRADHEHDGRAIVVSDLATLTSAELAVAAWLGVDADLLPKRSDGDYPPGRHWIPLAPECGEDEGERAVDAVCRDIEYRALGDFAQALDERLTQTEDLGGFYAPTIGRPLPCLAERKNVVKDRFEDEAQLGERCPYLAFAMPENPEQMEYLTKIIEGIRSFYTPVLAIALKAEREREERRALTALRLMLPKEH